AYAVDDSLERDVVAVCEGVAELARRTPELFRAVKGLIEESLNIEQYTIEVEGTSTMPRRLPAEVDCSKCGRRLELAHYQGYPPPGTPESEITRIFAARWPYFGVHCISCAHYTVFQPEPLTEKPT